MIDGWLPFPRRFMVHSPMHTAAGALRVAVEGRVSAARSCKVNVHHPP